MRIPLLVILLALCACPGPVANPYPPYPFDSGEPPVDSRFAGDWVAVGSVAVDGRLVEDVHLHLRAITQGGYLAVRGVCPGGEGGIGMMGEGADLRWSGELFCDLSQPNCPDARLWLTNGDVRLDSSGALHVALYGQLVGCGEYQLASIVLEGTQ